MQSVLMFSAVLHLAAIGLVAAIAVRIWLETRRPKEPGPAETVAAAAVLGLLVAAAVAILSWMGGRFGAAVTTGLVAGLLVALCFLLALGGLPHLRTPHGGPASVAMRWTAAAFGGVLVLTELVAFAFLAHGVRYG